MTTPARQKEADQASIAYHMALTQTGAATVKEALQLWAHVPPTNTTAVAGAWLKRAVHLVITRRRRSRDLAMAYYRLVRALRTGRTIADPRKPEPTYVTLDTLRREFRQLAGPAQQPQEGAERPAPAQEPEAPAEPSNGEPASADDEPAEDEEADRILVEEIAALDREQARLERAAEEEARIALEELGRKNLERKLRDIDTDAPASEVDAAREEAHRQAGTRQAAAAERVVMDGARGTVWSVAQRDRRALGYMRLSRTGTPCGWCAMLISRGPAYKSARSAEYSDGDKYHDNCHCYAEPIFSDQQYASSPLAELNREYQRLWPQVTRGLSGKEALSAWRRFIREQEKVRAQEARRRTSVQEA